MSAQGANGRKVSGIAVPPMGALTEQAHRPAYGSDGDYFSKPNAEDIVRVVKEMMAE